MSEELFDAIHNDDIDCMKLKRSSGKEQPACIVNLIKRRMMYYVMSWSGGQHPCRWIAGYPRWRGIWWISGARIKQDLPDPIEITLKPYNPHSDDHGHYMPEFFKGQIPLFRDDLIEALHRGGVYNFDTYNVALRDPDDGQVYTNYKAVNILGMIAAADMEKSEAMVHNNIPLIDVEFDKLVIDESKTHGTDMFRLAESCTLLVSQRLRDYLVKEGFDKIMFYDPAEVAI